MSEILANWISAIFTAGAVLVAVVIWWMDRRYARAAEENEERQGLRRLVSALRVEIEMASEATQRRQYASGAVVGGAAAAKAQGISVVDRPIVPGSATITDAIIYKQVAAQLGALPTELMSDVVRFYEMAAEVARLVEAHDSGVRAHATITELAPRIRMTAEMLVRRIEKFQSSNFANEADLKIPQEEIVAMAKRCGYPLEQVIKERTMVEGA